MRSKVVFDSRTSRRHGAAFAVLAGLVAACGSDRGGIVAPSTATDTTQGAGGATNTMSSTTAGGTDTGGAAGAGGADSAGAAGTAGGTGTGGSGNADSGTMTGDAGTLASCVFHTEPSVDVAAFYVLALDGGVSGDADPGDAATVSDATAPDASAPSNDGGARESGAPRTDSGGDAGPAPSITVQVSPFVGSYLADSAGRALYTYGADFAGDCDDLPITGCEADCLISWPLFDAGPRTLAPGLNDGAFGSYLRPDGKMQTTYYGWPLYYYKSDVTGGTLLGQAKSRTWHAATVIPMGIMIMKGATIMRYLSDGAGNTLYVYDQDAKGSATTDPTSACTGSCLVDHPSFWRNRLSYVSSLEPTDFSTFSPTDSRQQLAYKGAPLYTSAADARSGDIKGATTGWSVALP